MILELEQKGFGKIEILETIPTDLRKFLVAPANPLAVVGLDFNCLMQEFRGEGFSAWYSRYWLTAPTIIHAKGGVPFLELRIAVRNCIRGTWDKILNPELPEYYFQMGFVPYVVTKAIFETPLEYATFDIHFELKFLEKVGIDYKTLDQFINKVQKDKPAELSKEPHPCSPMMIDAVNLILHNSFTGAGKKRMLRDNVNNILTAALEIVGRDEIKKLPLFPADVEALHHVKRLIEEHCPIYLSNDVLIEKAEPRLNAFKLSYGFKRLFAVNPYEYYLQLRFTMAKKLLREGNTVSAIAYELRYESATTFIREFKKKFKYTPKYFQKNKD